MKIETKTYTSGNVVTIIKPDNNYKYVTNGKIYSTLVYLGKSDEISNWHNTNKEPPVISEPKS